ncbi:hypothetical protein CDAR_524601 [Caerostris darwini]|uniref:Secreted protein n=1 Tax=Caerostris darwini TaxID=1538125 RepID=A0AAV4PX97_9ARAC|nr:hypothetical protein CDAR_524601 [Caerostris darwini]
MGHVSKKEGGVGRMFFSSFIFFLWFSIFDSPGQCPSEREGLGRGVLPPPMNDGSSSRFDNRRHYGICFWCRVISVDGLKLPARNFSRGNLPKSVDPF